MMVEKHTVASLCTMWEVLLMNERFCHASNHQPLLPATIKYIVTIVIYCHMQQSSTLSPLLFIVICNNQLHKFNIFDADHKARYDRLSLIALEFARRQLQVYS